MITLQVPAVAAGINFSDVTEVFVHISVTAEILQSGFILQEMIFCGDAVLYDIFMYQHSRLTWPRG